MFCLRGRAFPLDEELDPLLGNLAPQFQEGLVRLSTHIPSFAKAARELTFFTGAQVHPDTARARTETAGAVCSSIRRYPAHPTAQMQYPHFIAGGWPIGNGMVESANKLVVEDCLKGAGIHWAEANVNSLLALRNAVCNDRWKEGKPPSLHPRTAELYYAARHKR